MVNAPQRFPFVALGLFVVFVGVFGTMHVLIEPEGPKRMSYDELLIAYDEANRSVAAAGSSDGSRVAGEAWLRCSQTQYRGITMVHVLPDERELDACEISAVNLASSRGYDRGQASHLIQQAREATGKIRAAYLDSYMNPKAEADAGKVP